MLESTVAKARSDAVLQARYKDIVTEAESRILSAVAEGKQAVSYTVNLDLDSKNYLKSVLLESGYTALFTGNYQGDSLKISWSQPYKRS